MHGENSLRRLQAPSARKRACRGAGILGAFIAAIAIAAAAMLWPIASAHAADSPVVLGSGKRTESIMVTTGESQNIRTDTISSTSWSATRRSPTWCR